MNAISQLISKLFRGSSLSGDDMIALLLILTMLASLTHLITMLVTRWGDRNTATKSLMASILVHGVCLLGLEVFEPGTIRRARVQVELPKPLETVTEVLVESDVNVTLPESGNVPIADRPTSPEVELERLADSSAELAISETPERTPDELEALTTVADDVTQFEQREMTELAVPTDSGEMDRSRLPRKTSHLTSRPPMSRIMPTCLSQKQNERKCRKGVPKRNAWRMIRPRCSRRRS